MASEKMAQITKASRQLIAMIVFVGVFALAEFAAGIVTDSLAILSDAFHMVSDLIGLIIGLFSLRLTLRPSSDSKTFGWSRAEVVGALVNGVFLLAVVMFICLDAIERFIDPPEVQNPLLVIIVGVVGLAVNLVGLVLFSSNATLASAGGHSHSHSHSGGASHTAEEHDAEAAAHDIEAGAHDIEGGGGGGVPAPVSNGPHKSANLHAVFLHVLGDALGSVGVIITGLVVMFVPYDWKYYFDPLLSMLLALIIGKSSIPLVRQSAQLLLQSVPESVDLNELSVKLLQVVGVDYIGSIHVWALNNEERVASAHIDCLKSCDFDQVSIEVKELFASYGIANVTIEPHFVDQPLPVDVEGKMHLAKAHATEFRCE
jgi:zinc transporter 1